MYVFCDVLTAVSKNCSPELARWQKITEISKLTAKGVKKIYFDPL